MAYVLTVFVEDPFAVYKSIEYFFMSNIGWLSLVLLATLPVLEISFQKIGKYSMEIYIYSALSMGLTYFIFHTSSELYAGIFCVALAMIVGYVMKKFGDKCFYIK